MPSPEPAAPWWEPSGWGSAEWIAVVLGIPGLIAFIWLVTDRRHSKRERRALVAKGLREYRALATDYADHCVGGYGSGSDVHRMNIPDSDIYGFVEEMAPIFEIADRISKHFPDESFPYPSRIKWAFDLRNACNAVARAYGLPVE